MFTADERGWDLAADVVVVGFGAAGAVCAITARDEGAGVLVLEKQSPEGHLSTSHMSGGFFVRPNAIPAAVTYMEHLSRADRNLYWTDREAIRAWAEYAFMNHQWLESLGGKPRLIGTGGEHRVPGSECIEVHFFPGLGYGLMKFLEGHVASRDIRVMYGAAADKLLTNARGEVVGVRALYNGEEIYVKASRAVVMTLGGFEFNEEMKLNFLKVYPTYFAGSPANTGDGIAMVQEVGAQLWHMNCCSAGWVLKFPELPIGLGPNFGGSRGFQKFGRDAATGYPCGFIIVDRYGRRYTNEIYKRHALYYELSLYDSQKMVYPRVPSYWIFDSKRINAGPLPMMFYGPMLYRLYTWSEDNGEEIRKGWVVRGERVQDLARQLGMDPSILQETLEDYNSCCARGKDDAFSRPLQHLLPLKGPPFFAVKVWPGSANTQGGPRRDAWARVLDAKGEPIPGLYAAGEFGSICGMLYPATGGNIAECIAFGRIAGENAAREPGW